MSNPSTTFQSIGTILPQQHGAVVVSSSTTNAAGMPPETHPCPPPIHATAVPVSSLTDSVIVVDNVIAVSQEMESMGTPVGQEMMPPERNVYPYNGGRVDDPMMIMMVDDAVDIDGDGDNNNNVKKNATTCLQLYIISLVVACIWIVIGFVANLWAFRDNSDQDGIVAVMSSIYTYPIVWVLLAFLLLVMIRYCRQESRLYSDDLPRTDQCCANLPSWQAWLQCSLAWMATVFAILYTWNVWGLFWLRSGLMEGSSLPSASAMLAVYLQWGLWLVFTFIFCMPLCCYAQDCIHRRPLQRS